MGDGFYRAAKIAGSPFRFRVLGWERVTTLPALFVGNHLGSTGPVQVILSLPVRLHPWVVEDMADRRLAPAYLYDDFVAPAWHLRGRAGMVVSSLVAQIAVSLIRGLDPVPVKRQHGLFDASLRGSLGLLTQGRSILIFPEDRHRALDPETQLRPFLHGFGWLCYLHDRAGGLPLPVYPLALHHGRRAVAVGHPRHLLPEGERRERVQRLCHDIEQDIAALCRALEQGAPLPT
jgi:hypothetical protein